MIDVYIVGAGGHGRVVLGQMLDDVACNKEWQIAGFLDERKHLLDGYNYDIGIVGDPITYVPKADDRFVCALGASEHRKTYAAPLLSKGAIFINILTEVYRGRNVKLGEGCFFERRVGIGPDSDIGDFVNIHSLAILGHDVKVGDYSDIGALSFIGGSVKIGAGVMVHPHSTILPGKVIGDGAIIGAGSVVISNVPAGVTVFGNPAKRLPR